MSPPSIWFIINIFIEYLRGIWQLTNITNKSGKYLNKIVIGIKKEIERWKKEILSSCCAFGNDGTEKVHVLMEDCPIKRKDTERKRNKYLSVPKVWEELMSLIT